MVGQKFGISDYKFALGLQLFLNCIVAVDRAMLNTEDKVYYLFENVSSMQKQIKEVMEKILFKLYGGQMNEINSRLVSAQNRSRIYFTNFGDIQQPEDRGILLRDILESGLGLNEKSYALTTRCMGAIPEDTLKRHRHEMVAEPVGVTKEGKSYVLTANYANGSGEKIGNYAAHTLTKGCKTMVAEPVGLEVLNINPSGKGMNGAVIHTNDKSRCLTTNKGEGQKIIEPIRIGDLPNDRGEIGGSQATRIYSIDGKSVNLVANGGGQGAKTGLYACPVGIAQRTRDTENGRAKIFEAREDLKSNSLTTVQSDCMVSEPIDIIDTPACLRYERTEYGKNVRKDYESGQIEERICNMREWHPRNDGKCNTITTVLKDNMIIETADGKTYPVYEVLNGQITIKGKQYPIKLVDGYYIIRKLTVVECCRLQGMPDWWFLDNDGNKIISDSQAYKGLGNGWQRDTVEHIMRYLPIDKDEEIICLSLYDGISTGRKILEDLNYDNVKYTAYEIDKYCTKLTSYRYPSTNHKGDAFQVRKEDWDYSKEFN